MPRKRTFPIQPDAPGDDESIVYKIFGTELNSTYLVIGDTVFLSNEGIEVIASTTGKYDTQNAYTFRDDNGNDLGGMYARDDTGFNLIALLAEDPTASGDTVFLTLQAESDASVVATAKAQVHITANREGETKDTYINIEKDNTTSSIDLNTTDRVRITPKLNLIGITAETCDIYIKDTFFIVKYDDGGTIRYKYIDLSGTGTTWIHSTSEP